LGYGLYVNSLVYGFLRLFHYDEQADALRNLMNHRHIKIKEPDRYEHEGFAVPGKPYYALWSYKIYNSERLDLLGNSLAVLFGIATQQRANEMIAWIEGECKLMKVNGELALDLPPVLFPYIRPEDSDWLKRYSQYNPPGYYHNGGVWPFVCGFYVAALVAAGQHELAEEKLAALTRLVKPAREADVDFGLLGFRRQLLHLE